MKYTILIIAFLASYFPHNALGQEDRFYTCVQYPSGINKRIDEYNLLIDSILFSAIEENYIFRYLETCQENTPEYGFQLHVDKVGEYLIKAFHFSPNAWETIYWDNKNIDKITLLTDYKRVNQNLANELLSVLDLFFQKQDTISSGPIYPGATCYKFYYQRERPLICGLVSAPGCKTLELIKIMDLLSKLSGEPNQDEIILRLKTLNYAFGR